jgi:tetratricopeptide (TPR) repeat protein
MRFRLDENKGPMKESDYLHRATESLREQYSEGCRLIGQNKLKDAVAALEAAIAAEPGFAPGYNKLGVAAVKSKDLQTAADWFLRALEVDGDYVPAMVNFGSVARERGVNHEAEHWYRRAIEIDPEYGSAYNNLGVVLREKGDYTGAVQCLKKARRYKAYSVSTAETGPSAFKGCAFVLAVLIAVGVAIVLLLR